MTDIEKAREMQAFENFPKLAAHIERMAVTGVTGSMYEWQGFTEALNEALSSAIAETREECAAWHDEQAAFYERTLTERTARLRAQTHRYSASAIRATWKESER